MPRRRKAINIRMESKNGLGTHPMKGTIGIRVIITTRNVVTWMIRSITRSKRFNTNSNLRKVITYQKAIKRYTLRWN